VSERSGQVSELLQRWVKGDHEALGAMAPMIYEALRRLADYHLKSRLDDRQGKIVQMKFFGGLSAPDIAQLLGISLATVEPDWRRRESSCVAK
jgi:DNA-directed RNA polymerase specialized sigma subunit